MTEQADPGTEGGGHDLRRPVEDRKVPWRVFVAIGGFLALIGLVYWAAAYEESGTVMLLVAAVLALWVGGYLWLRQPDEADKPPALPPEAPAAPATAAPAAPAAAAPSPPPAPTRAPSPSQVAAHAEAPYLPHASVCPFVIGLGAAGLAVGIVLGLWVVVPGVAFLALGIGGFIRQTRRRD